MPARLRLAVISAAILFSDSAFAQPVHLPQTRLTAVFPPGAQQGTTVDVAVTGGSDLDELSEIVFSHPGLRATQKVDGAGNPVGNTFTVSVDSSVEPGIYDLRIRGLFGISNPRAFRVDSLPELAEDDANNSRDAAKPLPLNTIVNARSNGTADVDMYRIEAKAGEAVVIRTEAARLDSLMQPSLQLFDARGRRIAESRRVHSRDAAIVVRSETDQVLTLKVHDIVFAGGNEYVYRISADTRPLVDYVMPPLVSPNQPTEIALFGRHLPGGELTEVLLDGMPVFRKPVTAQIDTHDIAAIGTESFAASLDTFLWNGIDGNLICLATYDATGSESRHTESITLPAEITGHFEAVNDEDIIRFEAKKDETWQIDVLSHRLGSPSNPLMVVEKINRAEDGSESFQRLAREVDNKQNPGANHLPTLTTDPSFTLTVPEDGSYRIRLQDRYATSRGSADLVWHLSIRKPERGFRIVVFDSLPSVDGQQPAGTGAVSLRKGGSYEVPVYAYRAGGHNDSIRLKAEGLPAGVTCGEAVIPAGQTSAFLVFTAAEDAAEVASPVRITATSDNATHVAGVATLVHGGANGLPRAGRMAGSLLVAVMKDAEPFSIELGEAVADVNQSQQLMLPVKITRRNGFDGNVDIAFIGQPGNVDVPPKVTIAQGADSAPARFFFKDNAATGYATLLAYGTAQVPYRRNPWLAERAQQKLDEAQAKLAAEQTKLEASKAQVAAAQQQITELTEKLKTLEQQLQTDQTTKETLTGQLTDATSQQTVAATQLRQLKEQLDAFATREGEASAEPLPENAPDTESARQEPGTSSGQPDLADFEAALQTVRQASASVEEAAKPVTALTQQAAEAAAKLKATTAAIEQHTAELTAVRTQLPTLEQIVQTAQAAVAEAEQVVAQFDAEKQKADEAAKQANEATKSNPVNVRLVGTPVLLSVHESAATISAAVPNEGAIRKGQTLDVTVTVTRKPAFTGALTVSLLTPEGDTVVTSRTAEIPADKTDAVLTLTAAADAAPGAIANAVIRATAEFNGRPANIDFPVSLKVAE